MGGVGRASVGYARVRGDGKALLDVIVEHVSRSVGTDKISQYRHPANRNYPPKAPNRQG